ncbi:MAG: fibronectin type III domain-containing protein [Rhodospirillales bacterium]
MTKRPWLYLPAAACLILAGCGYVGDPLPPSLQIPVAISDLSAIERGEMIVVSFTVPERTTDGAGLGRIKEVDLRLGTEPGDWIENSRKIETGVERPGEVRLEIPAKEWAGRDIVLGARVLSRKGRYSEWSNLVRLRVVEPLETPVVKAEGSAEGVRLSWTASRGRAGVTWRVFRRGPGRQEAELLASTSEPEYLDASVQRGSAYAYMAQAIMKSGDALAESEMSEPAEISYIDTFPPGVPSGLAAIAGLNSIQLTWNPNTEADLRGYYLYRGEEGGEFARAGGLLEAPSYTDRATEAGKRYRYAVSAVDQGGNESARCEAIEVVAQ